MAAAQHIRCVRTVGRLNGHNTDGVPSDKGSHCVTRLSMQAFQSPVQYLNLNHSTIMFLCYY